MEHEIVHTLYAMLKLPNFLSGLCSIPKKLVLRIFSKKCSSFSSLTNFVRVQTKKNFFFFKTNLFEEQGIDPNKT